MSAPGIHLHPTAELAPRVLLPGDPGRALSLAQVLLDGPRMFNHHRGLWGYTGSAADGEPLTIQSTGMGGPSAAIVLEELCDMGVRSAVRIGTCGALKDDLAFGDLVVAGAALSADGTSRALGASEQVAASAAITARLAAAADVAATLVVSTDVFYERDATRVAAWAAAGAVAVEMEAATLLRVGELRGVAVGCVLTVTDLLAGGGRARIDAHDLVAAAHRLGAVGAAGLGVPPRESLPQQGLVDPELEREKARRDAARAQATEAP